MVALLGCFAAQCKITEKSHYSRVICTLAYVNPHSKINSTLLQSVRKAERLAQAGGNHYESVSERGRQRCQGAVFSLSRLPLFLSLCSVKFTISAGRSGLDELASWWEWKTHTHLHTNMHTQHRRQEREEELRFKIPVVYFSLSHRNVSLSKMLYLSGAL